MTTPRENPSSIPATKPSDKLLKNFRATLEVRWSEFDRAIDQEFWMKAVFKGADPDYIKAKSTFDKAQSMLSTKNTDTELSSDPQIIAEVNTAIEALTVYLRDKVKPEERNKTHNIILAKTTADLATFKASITGKEDDKKAADIAVASEKAIPRAVVATAAVAGGASILSSAEAKTAMDEAKWEVSSEVKKAIGPWGMIFKWVKDVPAKEVADQIKAISKEYSEKKWMENPIDKFFSMIKLFFLKMQIGRAKMNLSEHMTDDELKLAGLPPKTQTLTQWAEKPIEKDRYKSARMVFETLLLDKKENLPYTNILENIQLKGSNLGELKKVHASKWLVPFLSKIGLSTDEKYQKWLGEILSSLFEWNKSKYVLEAYNSTKWLTKTAPHPESEKFSEYLITAGRVIKKMGWIAKASLTHKMPESPIKFDGEGGEVFFDDKDEGEEMAKLFDGDKKLMAYMLVTNASYQVKMSDVDKPIGGSTLTNQYPNETERQKAENTLRKVMNFGKSFMQGVIKNEDLHLGMNKELTTIMNERAFTLKGYALIYMTLGGKDIANFSNLSTVEQAQIYGVVMTLLQTEESKYQQWRLTSRYLTALSNSARPIPVWVSQFFKDAGVYAGEKGLEVLTEWGKYLAGLAHENPRLAALFAALNIPWIPARNAILDYFK